MDKKEVLTAVNSAYTYAVNSLLNNINKEREDFSGEKPFSLESGQVSGQVVDILKGNYVIRRK